MEFDEAEVKRCQQMSRLEREAYHEGHRIIAGVDEAGRGPLAGPVVAAAVVLPRGCIIPEINDSKQLTHLQRERVYWRVMETATDIGIAVIPPDVIDQINILQASWLAMRHAVSKLSEPPHFLLVDGYPIPGVESQLGVIAGDSKSISIAAASVIAKVTRDRIMQKLDALWPEYGFAKHKGYPTREHLEALQQHGVCRIHRRSFAPVAQQLLPLEESGG